MAYSFGRHLLVAKHANRWLFKRLASDCRGNSSISRMPGCGPNALPKNWI